MTVKGAMFRRSKEKKKMKNEEEELLVPTNFIRKYEEDRKIEYHLIIPNIFK